MASVIESPSTLSAATRTTGTALPWRGAERGASRGAPSGPQAGRSTAMPIAGLYQTGSTTHPGGSIPADRGGMRAVMLKDFGKKSG